MSNSDPPDWILDYIRLCQERLQLGHWNIKARLTEVPNRHDARSIALTSTVAGSMSAWISFKDDIAPNRDGYCTITHELLHLAFAPLDWELDHLFNEQPKKLRRRLWQAYNPRYETGIDHLAEALALQWMPAPGDNTTPATGSEPGINSIPDVS
jgi:hypothetical protein